MPSMTRDARDASALIARSIAGRSHAVVAASSLPRAAASRRNASKSHPRRASSANSPSPRPLSQNPPTPRALLAAGLSRAAFAANGSFVFFNPPSAENASSLINLPESSSSLASPAARVAFHRDRTARRPLEPRVAHRAFATLRRRAARVRLEPSLRASLATLRVVVIASSRLRRPRRGAARVVALDRRRARVKVHRGRARARPRGGQSGDALLYRAAELLALDLADVGARARFGSRRLLIHERHGHAPRGRGGGRGVRRRDAGRTREGGARMETNRRGVAINIKIRW